MTPMMPRCRSPFTRTLSLPFKLSTSGHFQAHFTITKFSSSKLLELKHDSLWLLRREEFKAHWVSHLASFEWRCPVSVAPANLAPVNYPLRNCRSMTSSAVQLDHGV